ncbi:S9 family peptidase [Paucibacter sp. APW11]|uniref:S9 family peptidase n=1 Tax=Roseateles aquae TaxID=3077235 RepID=A0ABU3P9X8_9BURK|nr:S9 family peptidase [Paucibacter sp. APW11]MDT8999015.1 S9 family peptidase [Paucibacter sp. APW11]
MSCNTPIWSLRSLFYQGFLLIGMASIATSAVAANTTASHSLAADGSIIRAAPTATRKPKDVSIHGDRRIDDFAWLRERESDSGLAYLRAEAHYTSEWFRPLQALSNELYAEMVGRIQQDDESAPVREGEYWYLNRTEKGAQYPLLVRRKADGPDRRYDPLAAQEFVLDLNLLSKGKKYLSLGTMSVSPDAALFAYTVDFSGARDFELRIRRISTATDLEWRATGVSSIAWSADGRSIFYVRTNKAKRSNQLWRHSLDSEAADALVFEEKDELFNLSLGSTADGRFLVLSSEAKDSREQRLLDSSKPLADWQTVIPRRRGLEYQVEHHQGNLYLTINDTGPNFRLVSLPLRRLPLMEADLLQAKELLAQSEEAQIESVTMFRSHLALQYRQGGSVKLRVYRHQDFSAQEVEFSEQAYIATSGGRLQNREYDTAQLRINYQSMTTPLTVYDFDMEAGRLTLKKRQPVLGGFDSARYVSKRIMATAADGTEIPVSLVYDRGLRLLGPQPLLLRGYGSYGIPSDPRFSASDISLLDRGVIVAIAHVRGGGDLGRRWYTEGKLAKKMNTFTDFIAAAETLIAKGYTLPEQLIINGGSAGGLLMGAVTNMRPDLFKAVVADVPFVDVINTMLDESLPLTTEEFIEWGNPKIIEQYRWMRTYSPYDNLKRGAYPAILVRTGLNDSQVPYWEPAKYVAKLRTLKTNETPLLFDINMDAGHGGASGRFDALRERAKVYAFMLNQWGLPRAQAQQ